MKLLTDLFENVEVLTPEELDNFVKNAKGLPRIVKSTILTLQKYSILSKDDIEGIMNASAVQLKAYAKKYKIPEDEIKSLATALRGLKLNIQLLPQYMTPETREAFIAGTKTVDDITLDLTSNKGRTAIVRQYAPLMHKIVNQYVGQSSLSRTELLSAAMMGLIKAMNDYGKNKTVQDETDANIDSNELKEKKRLTFQQYAGWRIQQQILADINEYSRNVRIPQNAYDKFKKENKPLYQAVRFDTAGDEDSADAAADRILQMSENPEDMKTPDAPETAKLWETAFKLIEEKFGLKKASIFYRVFGVNGYKQAKKQDIAKQNGISAPFVTYIVKNIIDFCRENTQLKYFLTELQDAISEAILADNHNSTRESIYESFIGNELYVYLENITKYDNKLVYENRIKEVLAAYNPNICDFLTECLKQGHEYIYSHYNTCSEIYTDFLENMNPSMVVSGDMSILNEMCYMSHKFNEFKIAL